MNYASSEEMAKKWGIKKRQVQALLANGRIPGAVKYGRFWMIPCGAEKPADLRLHRGLPEKPAPPSFPSHDMRATQDVFTEISGAAAVGEPSLYSIGGLSYLQGDFEVAKQCYRKAGNDNEAQLRLASIAVAAAVSTGDYAFYLEIENHLKGIIKETGDERVQALSELALAAACMCVLLPGMAPEWLKNGDFLRLPEETRAEAAYMRTRYFQSVGDYPSMLAVAQTALPFCTYSQELFHPGVYLKLMCAVAYLSKGRMEEAEKWLLDAMRGSLKLGLITPFAELLPMLGGLVEELLKREYPQYFDAVVAQWENTFSHWIIFRNRFTQDNIVVILSRREYQMAMLFAQGFSMKEIAGRFHISLSRQKAIMNEIYGKLLINNRKELLKLLPVYPKNSTF